MSNDPHRIFWRAARGETIAVEEWPAILDRARREGLLGHLAAIHPNIPGRAALRHEAAAQHLAHLALLRRVRSALDPLSIPWAVLKGLALAFRLYDDPTRRSCGDCDVLVRPDDEERAAEALRGAGFSPTPHHRELLCGTEGQVDLHTAFVNAERITSRGRVMTEAPAWHERTRRVGAPPDDLPALGDADLTRYLTLHFVHHHGCVGAKWIVDLDLLLRGRGDLEQIVRASGRTGGTVVSLVRILMRGEAVPLESSLDLIIARAAYEGTEIPGLRFLLSMRDMPRGADRAAFACEAVFPRRDVLASAGYQSRRAPILTHLRNIAVTLSGLAGAYRRSRCAILK